MKASAERLEQVKKKFDPIEISMDPGAGSGVKGEYLQPSPIFESIKSASDREDSFEQDDIGRVEISANFVLGNNM